MVHCPFCQTEIPVSPGALFAQCPNTACNGSFELDENGQIDLSSPAEEASHSSSVSHVMPLGNDEDPALPDVVDPDQNDWDQPTSEESLETSPSDSLSAPAEGDSESSVDDIEEEDEEFNENWHEESPPPIPGADPVGIEAYDKSDSSHHPQGLFYDVIVENLDTVDLKLSFFKILEQRRFGLNVEGIKKELKDGEVTLKQLNPVVASVLLSQLRDLDIQISWRQSLAVLQESQSTMTEVEESTGESEDDV